MMDVIKKTLLAGVGAAVITREKVETALDEFVKQGKVTSNEARQMAEKIAADGRREFETMTKDLSNLLRERFTREEQKMQDRFAALEARVAALERDAGLGEVPATATATAAGGGGGATVLDATGKAAEPGV